MKTRKYVTAVGVTFAAVGAVAAMSACSTHKVSWDAYANQMAVAGDKLNKMDVNNLTPAQATHAGRVIQSLDNSPTAKLNDRFYEVGKDFVDGAKFFNSAYAADNPVAAGQWASEAKHDVDKLNAQMKHAPKAVQDAYNGVSAW